MKLDLQNWTDEDIKNYQKYVLSLKGDDFNCQWEKRIVNTSLMCLARTSTKAKEIAKQILKGNYLSFIEKFPFETHADSIVLAYLICKIKDFEVFKKYLTKFAESADNWASCDSLKFKKWPKDKLLCLSKKFLKSKKTFVRRIAINILFEFIDSQNIKYIFEVFNALINEEEYYVNMCAAWLLCECFIKQRSLTLDYLKNNQTNKFVINKAISKCRDSFRVSSADKELLLNFKK